MKILHIVPSYYPAVRYGGPIYAIHALCRNLAAAGHQVHVFTTSVDGADDLDVRHGQAVERDGVQVHYFRSRMLRRIFYSADFVSELDSVVSGFDIVHLHSVFLIPTWAGARAAVRKNVPYVISPRGMLVRELIARRSATAKRTWIRFIERGNLSRAARIHLTSTEEHRALVDLGLALAPTAVIPNGVDAPNTFLAETISDDVRAVITERFDILSFGRINWKKGLETLIAAVAEVRAARVLIAGHDEDGYTGELWRVAQKYGVGNRVQFLPRQVTGADKEALFTAARVFALPSVSENFGNVVTEAMIRGVPVVVSARVGAAELVEESGGGVVVPCNAQDFAAILAKLLASDERLDAMGEAGAAYARERLNWDTIARRFVELYRDVSFRDNAVTRQLSTVHA